MPKIMALEGPRPDRLAQLRGELYANVPRRWWRAMSDLRGLGIPTDTPTVLVAIAGLVAGAWWSTRKRRR